MHYTILLYAGAPAPGEIDPEVIEAAQRGYQAFAKELVDSGAFVSGEVFDAQETAVCVSERDGATSLTMGPAQHAERPLSAAFVVDVASRDDAVGWAKKCPGVGYGVLEIRAAATSITPEGGWS